MKILVVDDDKEIVELLSIYLKNEGYEPIAAYSGKEAITKLTTTPDIALMILDIMMPNMSGIEVIKEVRKDSDIPIIIVSAKTGDMDKIQGLITGADDYVSKPFNPLEVMARVRSLLRRSQKQVKDDEPDVLEVGPLVINRDSHEVKTIDGKKLLYFQGDSDAAIVKGLIAIVVTLFSGKSKEEILNLDIDNSFAKIGLQEHLSPSRRNGLEAMLEKIKFYAQSLG